MSLDPEKRQRILEAATERFARFGYRKTSIDDVATAAGVGKGTVYLMAKNKEDLFYQVVHREIRLWVAEMSQHMDPRLPADQLLVLCHMLSLQYAQSRPLVQELLLGNFEETLPLWTEQLEDLRAIARQRNIEILEVGVRQGVFRSDLQVEVVSRILQDIHVAALLIAHRTKRPLEQQMLEAQVGVELLLNGLKSR